MEVISVHPGISCLANIELALSLQKQNQLQQVWVKTSSFLSLERAAPQSIRKHQLNKQPACQKSRWHLVSTADDRSQSAGHIKVCSKSRGAISTITTIQQEV